MIVETERLILREMNLDDLDSLHSVLSDKETMKYYVAPADLDKSKRWLKWCMDSYVKNGFGLWGVILKETNEFIGDLGISLQNINGNIVPEIGYHLDKKYHGRGLGTEGALACMKLGFEKFLFPEIYSYMTYDNIPSYRVAEKNGMKLVFEYFDEADGKMLKVYKMTKEEWEMRK